MKKFKYTGQAQILHMNTRKEGPEEEKELAVDLKFTADATAEIVEFFDADVLRSCLWLDSGAVRNPMMGALTFAHVLSDYRLQCVGGTFSGVSVKKFSIEPRDGWLVRLGFSVSFKPTSNEIGQFAEYLQDSFTVTLEPENQELDFGGGNQGQDASEPISDDDLYQKAVAIVMESGKASISLVQRHLRIGYNRAARMLEEMEAKGVVGPMSAEGNRRVLSSDTEATC